MKVRTSDGVTLIGQFVQDMLVERSVVVLLAPEDAQAERVVIALDSIATVEER